MSLGEKWQKYVIEEEPEKSSQTLSPKWQKYTEVETPQQKIKKGLSLEDINPTILGLLQGAGDIGASLGNLFTGAGTSPVGLGSFMDIPETENPFKHIKSDQLPKFPHPELGEYVDNDLGSKAQFIGGQIVPNLLAGGGLARGLAAIPQLGARGIIPAVSRGALAGAALGEGAPGGRETGALIGGGFGALSQIPTITNAGVGNRIVDTYRNLLQRFGNEYNNFFNQVERTGVNVAQRTIPRRDLRTFVRGSTTKHHRALQDYIQDNSVRNAHAAQSELNSFIRNSRGKDLTLTQERAVEAARNLRDQIRRDISRNLLRSGDHDLAFRYSDLTNRYRAEVGPYRSSSAIRKAALHPTEEGAINPARLPRKLSQERGDPFMAAMGHEYPELTINRLLASPAGKAIGAALGLGGLLKTYEALAD